MKEYENIYRRRKVVMFALGQYAKSGSISRCMFDNCDECFQQMADSNFHKIEATCTNYKNYTKIKFMLKDKLLWIRNIVIFSLFLDQEGYKVEFNEYI